MCAAGADPRAAVSALCCWTNTPLTICTPHVRLHVRTHARTSWAPGARRLVRHSTPSDMPATNSCTLHYLPSPLVTPLSQPCCTPPPMHNAPARHHVHVAAGVWRRGQPAGGRVPHGTAATRRWRGTGGRQRACTYLPLLVARAKCWLIAVRCALLASTPQRAQRRAWVLRCGRGRRCDLLRNVARMRTTQLSQYSARRIVVAWVCCPSEVSLLPCKVPHPFTSGRITSAASGRAAIERTDYESYTDLPTCTPLPARRPPPSHGG